MEKLPLLAQLSTLAASLQFVLFASSPVAAQAAPSNAVVALTASTAATVPVKTLDTIAVTGNRPTSIPSYIPTTVESITGAEIVEKINATDAEDALKYFPSLLVRKRYIGDFDHAVLASRASGTGNSARSLVYADGILLSNLLGNGANFTPRWALVTPEEIARVDVLYGPFSAAYPGNSVGAVVDYVTRMPSQFEGHASAGYFSQPFKQYGTNATYSGTQFSASLGHKSGAFSWWINANRLDSEGQPIAFATKLVSQGIAGTSGTAVTGAVASLNQRNQDWLILGDTNQNNTRQEHLKVKLAYDISPALRANYTLGIWQNNVDRASNSYLRDANGNAVYSGNINISGRQYSLSPTDFNVSRANLVHIVHGASLKTNTQGVFDWEIAASLYDYNKDLSRQALLAIPAANNGGAGRVTDQKGTGWNTLALKGVLRPSAHLVDFGLQRDSFKLRTLVSNTSGWLNGMAESRFSEFRGDASLTSVYAQDTWRFADTWRATLGGRFEQWRASNGAISDASSTVNLNSREENAFSPKAAIAFQTSRDWVLKASLGRAVRFPTVSELYQGSISATSIVNNDPNLKAEKSWTSELSAERDLGGGTLRSTLFFEDTRDALFSQINTSVTPNITNIQNVDHVRTRGVELAFQQNDVLIRGLEIISSVAYANSKTVQNDQFQASVGKWQPRVPQWRANLLFTYRANEKLSTTFGLRYSGRQYGSLDNSDANGTTYFGFSKFLVADIRLCYKFDKQWSGSIGVDNLNNEKYWAFHPYMQRTVLGEIKFDF
jgi:iron complex outermembrane recepter protein